MYNEEKKIIFDDKHTAQNDCHVKHIKSAHIHPYHRINTKTALFFF